MSERMDFSVSLDIWRRVIRLGTPVAGENVLGTLMRTTDVVISASLSPAAAVGLGIADLYAQVPWRISSGIAEAAGTLASQDTGAGATANRNEAFSLAILLGLVMAVPIAAVGVAFGPTLLRLVGAEGDAASLGGTYLSLVIVSTPFANVSEVTMRALQGMGDTKTPSYIGVSKNALNITLSLVLGVGLLGAPKFGIVGVGIGTVLANVAGFAGFLVATYGNPNLSFVRPQKHVVAIQLLHLGLPKIAAGLLTTVAVFPFNTLLLRYGTAVNAGYQVAWRLYFQVVGSFSGALATASSIVVGQQVGDEQYDAAYESTVSIALLGVIVAITTGATLVVLTGRLGEVFIEQSGAVEYATEFAIAFFASSFFAVPNDIFTAALSAASETRLPLLSRFVGMYVGLLGVPLLLSSHLGLGVGGAYLGVVACYLLMCLVSVWGFVSTDWRHRAGTMLAERDSTNK